MSNSEMKGLVAAAAAAAASMRPNIGQKRKAEEQLGAAVATDFSSSTTSSASAPTTTKKGRVTKDVSMARQRRLEQNRRAAIESRRRKKVMVAELQRSVDFYTKSNLSLAVHNRELEHKIILAKQRLQQMNATGEVKEGDVSSGNVLSKPEEVEVIAVTASRESKPVAAVTDPLPVSTTATLVNVKAEQEKAQLTAAQALYNTMGFPPAAARNAANNFSQFAGTTGSTSVANNASEVQPGNSSTSSTDDASIKAEVAAALKIAAGAESGKKVADNVVVEVAADHDQYIEALHQFAIQQTAVAKAAAASANAAIQAVNCYKMIKAQGGQCPTPLPFVSLPQLPKLQLPSMPTVPMPPSPGCVQNVSLKQP
ncbi:predicted protein [Thalassiosira pseudonana CCMP1335]|uniref:BZIP domain-containing protein n=1 Tax=Thalassiosira pseudonana TaxID=35128 RepID=B8CCL7_THAPS|nr:predicted protein [Thalassiosira pseudonana CCMP1335]EED88800.1 predicted protein [Thalassiosira pseudonana CCMP1335]